MTAIQTSQVGDDLGVSNHIHIYTYSAPKNLIGQSSCFPSTISGTPVCGFRENGDSAIGRPHLHLLPFQEMPWLIRASVGS